MADPVIVEYIARNRGQYSDAALYEQLVAAGHDRAAIDEAFAAVYQGGGPAADRPPWGSSLGEPRFWAAFLGYAGAVVGGFLVALAAPTESRLPSLLVLFLAAMAVGIGIVASERIDLAIRRGVACAIPTLAVVPAFILPLVGGLASQGLCQPAMYPS